MNDKYFILDTNVLLHYPHSLFSFAESNIIIPLKVIEELDKFKKERSEIGKNAREVIRLFDSLRIKGSFNDGIKMKEGGKLYIVYGKKAKMPAEMSHEIADDLIISVALHYKQRYGNVFFVSKDINARIKAQTLGIKAIDYEKQKASYDQLYTGYRETIIDTAFIDNLYKDDSVEAKEKYFSNEFVHFVDSKSEKHSCITRYNKGENKLYVVISKDMRASGIKPLNKEQVFAFNLLMDDSIKLVNLVGKAGTGKTLLAIACGLHKVIKDKQYNRLLVSRPIIPMGKDIGYLPGTKDEKLFNWMQPIFDNLEIIASLSSNDEEKKKYIASLQEQNILEVEALTYIRGRSLPGQYIVIDEAQNLTPLEVKTIISRAGDGTKIVMTGDPQQIDSPYLDENSNGLTYVIDRMKGYPIVGSVLLSKTERSELASIAAEVL